MTGSSMTRAVVLLGIGVMAVGGLAWFATADRYNIGLNDDAPRYLILGKSLQTGAGYKLLNEPQPKLHRAFPPGYPLILGTLFAATSNDDLVSAIPWVKALNFLFYLGAIALFFVIASRTDRLIAVIPAALLFAVHPEILTLSSLAMSEIPYLFSCLLAIVLFERLTEGAVREQNALGFGTMLALALIVSWPSYVRVVGISFGLAAVGWFAVHRPRKEALIFATLTGLFAMPWVLNYLTKGPVMTNFFGTLGDTSLSTFLLSIAGGVWTYLHLLPAAVTQGWRFSGIIFPVIHFVTLALVLVAFIRALRQRAHITEIYILAYLIILWLWPGREFRYAFAILPFLLLYFFRGLAMLLEWALRGFVLTRQAVVVATSAVFIIGSLIGFYPMYVEAAAHKAVPMPERRLGNGWDSYWQALLWVGSNAPGSAIVVTRNPALMHVYTSRTTITYPNADPERVVKFITDVGATYIVEDGFPWPQDRTMKYLRPALERLQGENHIRLVYEVGEEMPARIWEVRRP